MQSTKLAKSFRKSSEQEIGIRVYNSNSGYKVKSKWRPDIRIRLIKQKIRKESNING